MEEKELSGRELDAEIAVRLFGWEWLERVAHDYVTRKAIFPPDNADWVRVNFSVGQWTSAQATTERFSDWDDCCRNTDRTQHGMPRYSSDIAAAMQVVEKMESLNYQWQFSRTNPVKSIHDNLPHAEFWTYKVGVLQPIGMATAPTLAEAICRAALAAVNTQESKSSEASGEARSVE